MNVTQIAKSLASAKRPRSGSTSWYSYYAGYSEEFVSAVLDALRLEDDSAIFDPWSGSGTTARIGAERGHSVWGFDLNPALTVVAKARMVDPDVEPSLGSLAKDIVEHARDQRRQPRDDDFLLSWFTMATAGQLRSVERSIARLLIEDADEPISDTQMSPLAALFYVALFGTVHSNLAAFKTSNPTWIKRTSADLEKVEMLWASVELQFCTAVAQLGETLRHRGDAWRQPALLTADATKSAPVRQVDAVIASPPYCTRIDYVVATLPELAVLGRTGSDIRDLRTRMLGTPLLGRTAPRDARAEWGQTAVTFVQAVAAHESKASASYYRNFFTSYFHSALEALELITQATREAGTLVLVIQDSFYKEIHLDLAAVFSDMARLLGWTEQSRADLDTRVSKAIVNKGARAYRTTFTATESAIVLQR